MKCAGCGEESPEMTIVQVAGKKRKFCDDCVDRAREESEIADAAESVVQGMMEYKGRS